MSEEDQDYFDFEEVSDPSEDLDFEHLKPCPQCGQPIPCNAIICLYCGNSVASFKRPQWMIWVAVFVIIAFLLLVIF